MNEHTVIIDLYISSDEYLKLYKGTATMVNAVARDGRRIAFPARILQPFVTHEGVRGSFVIHFDKNRKFTGIQRVMSELG